MTDNKIPINRIIECSTVDGPGMRTTVFVQGCNIHCLYCHNPETQSLCINCGNCIPHCPGKALDDQNGNIRFHLERCLRCDTCIRLCPFHADPRVSYLSAEEVFSVIQKNRIFLRGITVSGGECALYPDFLTTLFSLCHTVRLNCLLDSNGMIDFQRYPNLMKETDGVMLDIKSWKNEIYQHLTGKDNAIVKKNLAYLDGIGKTEELRFVVVPGYTDTKESLDGVRSTLNPTKIKSTKIVLIRFRNQGVSGILSEKPSPSDSEMVELKNYANRLGFENVIIR